MKIYIISYIINKFDNNTNNSDNSQFKLFNKLNVKEKHLHDRIVFITCTY